MCNYDLGTRTKEATFRGQCFACPRNDTRESSAHTERGNLRLRENISILNKNCCALTGWPVVV